MSSIGIKTWRDVCSQVSRLNPSMSKVLNQIKGVNRFKVLQVRYHFGQNIVDHGQFNLPFQSQLYTYQDEVIPQQVRDMLDYHWQVLPFGMMIHNTVETFIELPTQTIPFYLHHPGHVFSLLNIFENAEESLVMTDTFSMAAGCRSLITLPQIAHSQYQSRVAKRLNLSQQFIPKHFSEQWSFFKAISQARQEQHGWSCELIFFGREFIEAIDNIPLLKNQLLVGAWHSTILTRNQYVYDLLWSSFLEKNQLLVTRNSVSAMETVNYLLRVILNISPAYAPATLDEVGPIDVLSRVLLDIYRIRYYLPVFMQLQHYNGQSPLYYSLRKPACMRAMSTKGQSARQTMNDLKHIKHTLTLFKEQVLNHQLPISANNSLLYKRLQEVEFEYYHPKAGGSIETNIPQLLSQDKRFSDIKYRYRHYNTLSLPDTSTFFHGCIKITPKV